MCGIAGSFGRGADSAVVRRMIDALAHRGPDGEGLLELSNGTMAHRRLSIIDLSDAGKQPMVSHDGRFAITFNGEIYNYKELREELIGYPFSSQTDTEVILAAWEKWGEACLDRMLGMFAFAITDKTTGEVTVVRDRLGIKPLFYALQDGRLFFASEIKALLAAGVRVEPNEKIISHYLLRGYYDHSEETFFKNISILRGGHLLRFCEGELETKRWWYLPERVETVASLSDDELVESFRALLDDSLRLHLRSDVPVGVNLSSGIDSLSLFFELNRIMDLKSLNIFSMGFEEKAYDETEDIMHLSHDFGVPFHRTAIEPGVFNRTIDQTVAALDQPFGGVSTMGYYDLMSSHRKNGVIVVLEGQGVDEILAGYRYFYGPYYRDLVRQGRLGEIGAEIGRAAQDNNPLHLLQSALAFGKTWRDAGKSAFQDGTKFLRFDCLKESWVAKAGKYAAPEFERPFPDHLRNALYRDTIYTKLPRVLRFNDHISMAHGLELRVPYLDHRIVEFAFCLEDRWKIRGGKSKFMLREAMRGVVPEDLRTRQKRPQSSPQTTWFKTRLKDDVLRELSSRALKELPMVDAEKAQESFRRFVGNDKDNNSFFYWQLINLARWYKMYF